MFLEYFKICNSTADLKLTLHFYRHAFKNHIFNRNLQYGSIKNMILKA